MGKQGDQGIINSIPKEFKRSSMKIRSFTLEEYLKRVKGFHGYTAPGVIIGGFMLDLAYQLLPEGGLFNALCETPKCLPDAIQLLTPCTIGNGWLIVMNTGRFAMVLYDKDTGEGIRVFVDPVKIEAWPEIKGWFLKLKPKKEQDSELLLEEIKEGATGIFSTQYVRVADRFLKKIHRGGLAICPHCNEAYPLADGPLCLGCQFENLYVVLEEGKTEADRCGARGALDRVA